MKRLYMFFSFIVFLFIIFFNCQQAGGSKGGGHGGDDDDDDSSSSTWTTKLLGVSGTYTEAHGITSDSSGNVYTTGETYGNLDGQTLTGNEDLFVVKYDSNGVKLWTRLLGVSGVNTKAYGITSDSSGNIYATGSTKGNLDGQILTGNEDLFVVKYDSNGVKQWTRLLGDSGDGTYGFGITSDSSGNIYTTGSTKGNLDGQILTGFVDLFIVKYNPNGIKQWTRLLGVSGVTEARGITSDSSGNVYTTGSTNGNLDGQILTGNEDLFVAKYDSNGVKQWTRLLGVSEANTRASGIASDSSGNVYTTGSTNGNLDGQTLTGDYDLFVVKYDSNGDKQWTRHLGVFGFTTKARGITSDSSGNVYTTGSTYGDLDGQLLTGGNDLFVVKYDTNGVRLWTRLLGVAGVGTYANGIISDSSGNIYTTGYTEGNLDGQTLTGTCDLFVVKYDSNGVKQ